MSARTHPPAAKVRNADMIRLSELKLPLGHAPQDLEAAILDALGIPRGELLTFSVARRSNDARRRSAVQRVYSVDLRLKNEAEALRRGAVGARLHPAPDDAYRPAAQAPEGLSGPPPVVVGAGPCGLFAALILAEAGFRPLILERGKAVRERTKDTWGLWRRGVLDPNSNVQFGEGGAGTFSDGKLYSQIKDPRHLGRKVLTELVAAGAPEEILIEAHPHIGTFRLVGMLERLRSRIIALGGRYRFETQVVDLEIAQDERGRRRMRALHLAGGERLAADHVVLAVGHSARDMFEALHARGVTLEAKPFSVGFRIEHPQSWIDKARYGPFAGHEDLGAAAYSLAHHAASGRTAYSFCMCPGGTVVAAASEPDGLVTNGMSQYSRNERNANAGIVVGVAPSDYPGHALAGVAFQRRLERRAFAAGGGGFRAPAQRVGDFLAERPSAALGEVLPSYRPGTTATDVAACVPDYVAAAVREALPAFGRQIPGFDAPDAVLTAVETRTSAPVRTTRGANRQSLNTLGLFPAGEGAGYAGGILSAAVDGIKTAEAVALSILEAQAWRSCEPDSPAPRRG
jgi:uncharacterized FAD-dependent dehydrogenase